MVFSSECQSHRRNVHLSRNHQNGVDCLDLSSTGGNVWTVASNPFHIVDTDDLLQAIRIHIVWTALWIPVIFKEFYIQYALTKKLTFFLLQYENTWCAWHNVCNLCNKLECGISRKWSKRATDVRKVCSWDNLWFASESCTRNRAISSFKFYIK